MPKISYYINAAGKEAAKWPGKTVYIDGKARKSGQQNIGLVVNKAKNVFWNRKYGYCTFNTDTQTFEEADPKDIPKKWIDPDGTKQELPVCVDFGDSFFLNELVNGIGYQEVLDSIDYSIKDRLKAMFFYYTLEDTANNHADEWFRQNFIRFLFPKANIYSQRISEFLEAIGNENVKRKFLIKHIEYVLENTDDEVCVLIDSTGLPNACDLSITRVSNHQGDVNVEFRLVLLVQKSTGLPLYYEVVPGNIVDITTITYIMEVAKKHNCKVDYALGDAGYCCPKTMEKLILAGIDFMMRLNPAYPMYEDVMNEYGDEVASQTTGIRYKDRYVAVKKIPTVVGYTKDNKPKNGFVYLCKDINSAYAKRMNYMKAKGFAALSEEEKQRLMKRCGMFAIVTTKNLSVEEILPNYYIRQGVEQFFDFGKNYAKLLPVREHKIETVNGHMLLAFMATFMVVMVNNRLNVASDSYVSLPMKQVSLEEITEDSDYVIIADEKGNKTYYIEQEPVEGVSSKSVISLFYELRGNKAQVFDDEIIPCPAVKQANDFYNAFKIRKATTIHIQNDDLVYEYETKKGAILSKKLLFSRKSKVDKEKLDKEKKKRKKKQKDENGTTTSNDSTAPKEDAPVTSAAASIEPPKSKRGRKPGSRNKNGYHKKSDWWEKRKHTDK